MQVIPLHHYGIYWMCSKRNSDIICYICVVWKRLTLEEDIKWVVYQAFVGRINFLISDILRSRSKCLLVLFSRGLLK